MAGVEKALETAICEDVAVTLGSCVQRLKRSKSNLVQFNVAYFAVFRRGRTVTTRLRKSTPAHVKEYCSLRRIPV